MSIEIRNATITRVRLGLNDHDWWTVWLDLRYSTGGQNFGGFPLQGVALHYFVARVCRVAGVREWDQLVGRPIRAFAEHVKVHAIGHYLDDHWFSAGELDVLQWYLRQHGLGFRDFSSLVAKMEKDADERGRPGPKSAREGEFSDWLDQLDLIPDNEKKEPTP